ncbi:pectinesterase inhibitor 12-like [Phragmites australis]|uniref:pectinesterase inhibitor 12-like n=1 Tax=Phragmites australis TaxID=29695 RepID=UPI002D7713BF|nr:pectinesterase inhibitor 12-like [Phragmites australis]
MGMRGDSVFTTSLCLAILLLRSIAPAQAAELESAPTEECANPVSVEVACRGASETHAAVAYEHCVASLAGDPRSKEAGNMHGLAVLATKLAIDHAASTESKIDDLSELEDSPHARARFNHCLEQYGGATDLLRDALDNLQAHIYGKAIEQLAAALGASESCEDAWKGEEHVPVAGHDREYGRMAHIALGLTHAAA